MGSPTVSQFRITKCVVHMGAGGRAFTPPVRGGQPTDVSEERALPCAEQIHFPGWLGNILQEGINTGAQGKRRSQLRAAQSTRALLHLAGVGDHSGPASEDAGDAEVSVLVVSCAFRAWLWQ